MSVGGRCGVLTALLLLSSRVGVIPLWHTGIGVTRQNVTLGRVAHVGRVNSHDVVWNDMGWYRLTKEDYRHELDLLY